jgi:hypothetical protein
MDAPTSEVGYNSAKTRRGTTKPIQAFGGNVKNNILGVVMNSQTLGQSVLGVKLEPQTSRKRNNILDFKLSSCLTFSSWLFPGFCILNSNVSEHCVFSIFIGELVGKRYLPTL